MHCIAVQQRIVCECKCRITHDQRSPLMGEFTFRDWPKNKNHPDQRWNTHVPKFCRFISWFKNQPTTPQKRAPPDTAFDVLFHEQRLFWGDVHWRLRDDNGYPEWDDWDPIICLFPSRQRPGPDGADVGFRHGRVWIGVLQWRVQCHLGVVCPSGCIPTNPPRTHPFF